MEKTESIGSELGKSIGMFLIVPSVAALIFFKGIIPLMFEANPGSEAPYWLVLMFLIMVPGALIGGLVYTQYFKKEKGETK